MKRIIRLTQRVQLVALPIALGFAACGGNTGRPPVVNTDQPDLARNLMFEDPDLAMEQGDLYDPSNLEPDPCGSSPKDPECQDRKFGPPDEQFSLTSDPMPNPNAKDNGISRDPNGWLKLDSTHTVFNYLWIANYTDAGSKGTVSKIDSKTVREVARYYTVTCFSLKTGSTAQCDGNNGCCSIDDWARYQARKNKMPEPGHQAVNLSSNAPSRTSVDFNGDLFIANRAFGLQSSVTRVSNDPMGCVDRNRNGRIDTSSDTSGNGFIEIDCNGDGAPDNSASVLAKPCSNNLKQEFYGEDDECIVWTSNTFPSGSVGRPLGLAGGDGQVSDAWAGTYNNAATETFIRIDGVTGKAKEGAKLDPSCRPYGLAVDAFGIGWAPNLGSGCLGYFNTRKVTEVGVARDPQWGKMAGYGVTLDRDQNVWVGSQVARYTPDRSNGFKNLGQGWWTRAGNLGGIGIAADSRNMNDYFVYSCSGGTVTQIPASTMKVMKMDQTINNPGWPTIQMPCYGVGVDSDQHVWGISMGMSTRATLDPKGAITQPKVNTPPMGNNKCPAGDQCPNVSAYTYSDFTGFGLRNFTRPVGSYQMVVKGCTDRDGNAIDTQWFAVNYDADVPPSTQLLVHAKAGNSNNLAHPSWVGAQFTPDAQMSPLFLQGVLHPNLDPAMPNEVVNDAWLLVEFVFKTSAQNASPKLKHFDVAFKCTVLPG